MGKTYVHDENGRPISCPHCGSASWRRLVSSGKVRCLRCGGEYEASTPVLEHAD